MVGMGAPAGAAPSSIAASKTKERRIMPSPSATVYVLACADGSLYTGATVDLGRRMRAHRLGTAARYTRARLPVRLVAWWDTADFNAARSQEALFKRFTRAEKLAALAGNEAFGSPLHKPPLIHTRPDREEMPMRTRPQADELDAYSEEARTSRVRISTDKGDIVLELFPDDAPIHTAAFLKLVKDGFYDGLAFHRVEPGFVIQGGDPDGNGTGGPGYRLPAEFNSRSHLRGTLAMARTSDPDSAGSQFYICLADTRFLDGQYTVFGQTVDGIETIDKIKKGDKMNTLTVEPISA
jgi:cyclophilin family peptidyl-prolyl cis-trans isomerase/predicted GIY-YIG superfamily endonuclease